MDWTQWEVWYKKIIIDFGFDRKKDLEAALILNELLEKRDEILRFEAIKPLIQDKIVFVYGCGPSLPIHLNHVRKSKLPLKDITHIAADGATSALLDNKIVPHIIVTDLDGEISDLIAANKQGSIMIVHAHGDNIHLIKDNLPFFPGRILGTTQIEPLSHVKNFGGFTDGDRCVFLAVELESSLIVLFGFDLGKIVGKYSKPFLKTNVEADELKKRKLQWAQRLITELSLNRKSVIIRVNGKEKLGGNIKNYNFEQLLRFLKKSH